MRTIPRITGNLSVEQLLAVQEGRPLLPGGVHDRELAEFAELGFDAVEDYLAWAVAEPEPGRFDFSFYAANARRCRELGLRYVVYPWIHVVPRWLEPGSWTRFRCLEHGRECAWPSVFAATTLESYRRFYAALHASLGAALDGICVALPADYGEVGYPTGIASWVAQPVAPHDHVHPGYWCGDAPAAEAFARHCEAAGMARATPDLAAAASSEDPRERELFAAFYVDSMTGFVDRVLAVVRGLFPGLPLEIKVGHGGEPLLYGIDPSGLAKVARRHGTGLRSTQATLPEIHQKRCAAACRFHGVPWSSEPPVDVGRDTFTRRLFSDVSEGASAVFDYAESAVGCRDLWDAHGALLRGESPVLDVALLFPAADLRQVKEQGMPPLLMDVVGPLRRRLDFELVDERMIRDGALRSVAVLGWIEGTPDAACQERILEFVAAGGILVAGARAAASGALAEHLRAAPEAGERVRLHGVPAAAQQVTLGRAGDTLFLGGQWHHREDASQFRSALPTGEPCRWTGAELSCFFPARAGRRCLVEVEAWVHPATVHERHEVFVDGRRAGALLRPGLQRFAAWVAPAAREDGDACEVTLASDVFRPADLGLAPDSRALGVALLWVRLTEEHCAAGEGQATEPRLAGVVDAADLEAAAFGRGSVVVSRRAPLLRWLALLEAAARRRSRWFAALAETGLPPALPDGVSAAVLPSQVVLHNASAAAVTVERAGARITLPAGGLFRVPRNHAGAP